MNRTAAARAQLDRAFVEDWGLRFADTWNAHDPDAIAALCTEDVNYNDPAMPEPAHGRQAVRDFARFTFSFFPDFHVEPREDVYISSIEPRALCPYRMAAGSAAAAISLRLDAIDQWTFRDGLLSHYLTYYDHAEMLAQLSPRR